MATAKKNTDVSGRKPEGTAAKDAAPAPQDVKRRPIQSFREGDVSASVWAREVLVKGKPATFHSVSVERSYRDRDGAYRYTRNFDASDLGALMSVIQRSAEYIHGLQAQPPAQPMPDQAE